MQRDDKQQTLFFDIKLPAHSDLQKIHNSIAETKSGTKHIAVKSKQEIKLKPDHSSRLKFYSAISATNGPVDRIQRARQIPMDLVEEDFIKNSSNNTMNDIAVSNEHIEAELSTLDDIDEEQLLDIKMDDIRSRFAYQSDASEAVQSLGQRLRQRTTQIIRTVRLFTERIKSNLHHDVAINMPRANKPMAINFYRLNTEFDALRQKRVALNESLRKPSKKILVISLLVLAALGYLFIIAPVLQHNRQDAAQSAAWQKSQAQWQCAVRQYEAQTGVSNNKESSCLNQN